MNIAVTIIHNRGDQANIDQINLVKSLVQEVKVPVFNPDGTPLLDEETNLPTETFHHYQVTGLNVPHEIYFYQIIPFGVTPPPNKDELHSHKVYYGLGDEDKIGNHPRFFNWGLKRGTDYGADLSIYLDVPNQLTSTRLRNSLNKLVGGVEFVESTFGKIATLKLLKEVGQLDEKRALTSAFTDLKARVVQKGFKNG